MINVIKHLADIDRNIIIHNRYTQTHQFIKYTKDNKIRIRVNVDNLLYDDVNLKNK